MKNGGNFAFLITQAVFKTKGAGEGFRRFKIKDTPLEVVKVHDLVEINPFEGASNRTAVIFIKKKEKHLFSIKTNFKSDFENNKISEDLRKIFESNQYPLSGSVKILTAANKEWKIRDEDKEFIIRESDNQLNIYKGAYPVKYELWKKKRESIYPRDNLEEALRKSSRIKILAYPSDEKNKLSPWLTLPEKAFNAVNKIKGKGYYHGYEGINSGGANAVYWLNILGVASRIKEKIDIPAYLRNILGIKDEEIEIKKIVVENITEGMKKEVKKVRTAIEDFFVFPLIKTQHLKKWKLKGYVYTLQMQDPKKRIGYDERWVKVNFSKTYGYLKGFEEILKERAAYKKYLGKAPFYSMYGLGEYTFSPYKVVWNRMGSKLSACVISYVNDEFLGEKVVLPSEVITFIPTENENEAHFICAVLNSSEVNLAIRSIAGGTKSFGTPKIIENTIGIPNFDANNEVHSKLAELSKKAHEIAAKEEEEELREVEEEIDSMVARLFGLSEEEIGDVKEALQVVYGEVEEAEEEIEKGEEEVKTEEAPRRRALEGVVKKFKKE